jgi:protein-S-isoprenylcysteine O-methyltransferase Ste14
MGDVMILMGAVLWLDAWPSLLVVGTFVVLLQRQFITPEEFRLRIHFADIFSVYHAHTRRWI